MINLLIWSRDRACQLETLLESIDTFADNIFRISVLYSSSNNEYDAGYEKLFDGYLDGYNSPISFHKKIQNQGKEQTLDIIKNGGQHVCLSTDDTILFAPVNFAKQMMDKVGCFSLRLGLNTRLQDYSRNAWQPPLSRYVNEGDTISWNINDYNASHNYGYPFSVDMHVYDKDFLTDCLQSIEFDKPNEMESGLYYLRHRICPIMRSFKHSVAVNVPITNMSQITPTAGVSLEELNTHWLLGKILRYKYRPQDIVGCHQILEYEWITN